jgi:opacity protein-like surface antigen
MKKMMMIAAVAALLTACGGANDGDSNTDTTAMPAEPMTIDSNSNAGSVPYDSLQDTSGFSSSPTNPGSRTSTPGGSTNQNDSTRQ